MVSSISSSSHSNSSSRPQKRAHPNSIQDFVNRTLQSSSTVRMQDGLSRKRTYKTATPDEQLLALTKTKKYSWDLVVKLINEGASLNNPDFYALNQNGGSFVYALFAAAPAETKNLILSQISPEKIDPSELPLFLTELMSSVPAELTLAFIDRLPHTKTETELKFFKENTLSENIQILKALREKGISIRNLAIFFFGWHSKVFESEPYIAVEYVEQTHPLDPPLFDMKRFFIGIMLNHNLSKVYTRQILKYLFHTKLNQKSLREIDAAWRQVKPYRYGGVILALKWIDSIDSSWLINKAGDHWRFFKDLTRIYLRYPDFAELKRYSSHFDLHESQYGSSLQMRYTNQKKLQQAVRFVCSKYQMDRDLAQFLASINASKFREALKKGHSATCALVEACDDPKLKNLAVLDFHIHDFFTLEDCRLILMPLLPESSLSRECAQDAVGWRSVVWSTFKLKINEPFYHDSELPPSWIDVLLHLFMNHINTTADFKLHLRHMTSNQFLRFMMHLFYKPEHANALLQKFHRLEEIEIRDGGKAPNTWEPFLEICLAHLRTLPARLHSCVREFEEKLKACKSEDIPKVSTQWFEQIKKEGWSMQKHQGRTTLFRHPEKAEVLAVKWQKLDESPLSLIRESETIHFLHQNYEELGLKSEYPTSHGVVQFVGRLTNDMLESIELPLEMDKDSSTNVAYIYTCSTGSYFNYLSSAEIDKETFQKGRIAALHDLHVLARAGLVMTSLADLFHNRTDNERRVDKGRYIVYPGLMMGGWRKGRGSGRIDKFVKAVEYVNTRSSGLADVGDSEFLSSLEDEEHPFIKHFLPKMVHIEDDCHAFDRLQTLFLGEYSLVDELVLGVWSKKRDQLDWKDDAKVTELQKSLLQGGAYSLSVFSKQPIWRTARFMEANMDMKRYSRQMHFWMDENAYRPFIADRSLPAEIYDPETKTTVDSTASMRGWKEDLGFAYDGVNLDLGTVNGPYPIKDGERWRNLGIPYMLMLRAAEHLSRTHYSKAVMNVIKRKWEAAVVDLNEVLSLNYYSVAANKLAAVVWSKMNRPEESSEYKRQWAALTIQNSWRKGREARL